MRAIFLVLIAGVIALIAAIHFGLIDIRQSRPAALPTVEARDGHVEATGGQAPAFDVATGSVEVTQTNGSVTVPKVSVETERKGVALPTVTVRQADTNQAD